MQCWPYSLLKVTPTYRTTWLVQHSKIFFSQLQPISFVGLFQPSTIQQVSTKDNAHNIRGSYHIWNWWWYHIRKSGDDDYLGGRWRRGEESNVMMGIHQSNLSPILSFATTIIPVCFCTVFHLLVQYPWEGDWWGSDGQNIITAIKAIANMHLNLTFSFKDYLNLDKTFPIINSEWFWFISKWVFRNMVWHT